jgi:hypothetical protein
MIMYEDTLRIRHCSLNRLQLRGYIDAWLSGFDHRDYMIQMTSRALQPLDQCRMGLMSMRFFHNLIVSPRGG